MVWGWHLRDPSESLPILESHTHLTWPSDLVSPFVTALWLGKTNRKLLLRHVEMHNDNPLGISSNPIYGERDESIKSRGSYHPTADLYLWAEPD